MSLSTSATDRTSNIATENQGCRRKRWSYDKRVGFLVFLPSALVMFTLGVYPVVRVFTYSLYKVDVFLKNQRFIGVGNIGKVLGWGEFWGALWNDVVFTGGSIIIQVIIGVFIALLLNRHFYGRGIARSIVMFSYLVPLVVAMMIWKFMLHDIVGIVNYVIEAWHLPIPTTWFGDISTAMPTVILVNVWKFFPFMVLVLLAQLQSIDPVLYEAARVDGSTVWQEFWYITLPMLKPVIVIAVMLRTIWHFNNFAVISLLTGGGPIGSTRTPPLLIYDLVFANWNLGRGAAVAVIMFLILITMSAMYIKLYKWAESQLS